MDGMLVHRRLPPAFLSGCPNNSLIPIYEKHCESKVCSQEHNTMTLLAIARLSPLDPEPWHPEPWPGLLCCVLGQDTALTVPLYPGLQMGTDKLLG